MSSNLDLIRGRQTVVPMTNKSGTERSEGEVVIVDVANDDAFTTTVVAGDTQVAGIVAETIANNAIGRVIICGKAPIVEVDAATGRGNFLRTGTTAGKATPSVAIVEGVFAKALSATVGAGQVSALLYGCSLGAGTGEEYPPSWKFDLDEPKAVPDDPPDDEFAQGAGGLDGQWTVVDGNSGVCSLTYGGGDRYDLTSRVGWLLIQADFGNPVKLRQDYTLPDGKSIVLALAPSLMADAQAGIANNELQVGMSLNDNDGDYNAGNYTFINIDPNVEGWRMFKAGPGGVCSTPSSANPLCSCPLAEKIYLRIARDGLDYYCSWSTDGTTWFPFKKDTHGGALTNIWIWCASSAAFGDPTPIQAIDWLRLGGNNVDPW